MNAYGEAVPLIGQPHLPTTEALASNVSRRLLTSATPLHSQQQPYTSWYGGMLEDAFVMSGGDVHVPVSQGLQTDGAAFQAAIAERGLKSMHSDHAAPRPTTFSSAGSGSYA